MKSGRNLTNFLFLFYYFVARDISLIKKMKELIKSQPRVKSWNIKLKVSPEEESMIKKSAIDYQMGLAEYIKHKLLDRLSANKISSSG